MASGAALPYPGSRHFLEHPIMHLLAPLLSAVLLADPSPEPGPTWPSSTPAHRRTSQNNLKMVRLAMHNFHDAMGRFPAATAYAKNGKPLLSWRVAILPYIEEDALYRQFKLDEPWDSPHNKKLIAKMPKIYA